MPTEIAPRDRLIVALDLPGVAEAEAMITRLGDAVTFYKIGMELTYAGGLGLAERLAADGKQVFMDLKLHDIPNTVAGAIRSVVPLGPTYITIHASGGRAMMKAAAEAAEQAREPQHRGNEETRGYEADRQRGPIAALRERTHRGADPDRAAGVGGELLGIAPEPDGAERHQRRRRNAQDARDGTDTPQPSHGGALQRWAHKGCHASSLHD